MSEDDTTFTYDWNEAERRGDFAGWLLPALLAGVPHNGASARLAEKLREATDGFTNVKLTIQVNGVDIPVEAFLKGIEGNMTLQADRAAAKRVASIPRLQGLENLMRDTDRALRDHLRGALAGSGVELPEDDEDWER